MVIAIDRSRARAGPIGGSVKPASILIFALTLMATPVACAQENSAPPALLLDHAISLPDVRGRIDHLAIDPSHQRLAIAELENRSVDIVDVATGNLVHRITGVAEPQGVAFDSSNALLIVAARASGGLQLFDAHTFQPVASIALGEDADNVRIDPRNGHAIVGYGDGALALIDLSSKSVLTRIALPAHPEGFQIDPRTARVFVNLPDRHTIGAVDLDHASLLSTWRLPRLLWNYPLALDSDGSRVAVAFRGPARLVIFSPEGAEIASAPTCGDADDLFFDSRRDRLYVACGGGAIDAFDMSGASPRALGRTKTSPGARTALFVPELDRLFVAARAEGQHQASILVMRPAPRTAP